MPTKKVQRKRPNYDALMRALGGYGSSTPELDRCIAEAEQASRSAEAFRRQLIADYGQPTAPGANERCLEIKPATFDPQSQSETSSGPFLSQIGLEPPEVSRPDWMQPLKSVEERLGELEEILWADVKFWKRVAAGYSAAELSGYIRDHYGLDFPAWSTLVWQQMVQQHQKRDKLLSLSRICFTAQRNEGELRDLGKKLPPILAGELVWEHLLARGLRHTHVLASVGLEPTSLGILINALRKLTTDAEWCQAHPGVVPPRLAPNPRHAPKDVVCVRAVERFVERLLNDLTLTNVDLAKLPIGGTYDARLKWAGQARDLVQYRENAAVKRYSEQREGRIIGRKPRRFRKAAPGR